VAADVARRIDAVLFDWGDTLFRSPSGADAIVAGARERGVAVDPRRARELWDELWEAGKTPEELAKGRDLSPEAHRRVWTALFTRADALAPGLSGALYQRVMDARRWVPYADTRPTLEGIRARGLRTGVVSNIAYDLREVFAAHGLAGLVDAYVLSFEKGVMKPSPRLFALACEELGTAPARTLMVGDHPEADGAAAAAAGLQVYVLPPGYEGTTRGLDRVLALVDASRR
jgi:HAD superfamily hydrolase (TIGR01493 family)